MTGSLVQSRNFAAEIGSETVLFGVQWPSP
jgi:hypothetical protein